MKLIRLVIALSALIFSTHASAGLSSFEFSAINDDEQFAGGKVYPTGTVFHGHFQLGEAELVYEDPVQREYGGMFTGSFQIGSNMVQFNDGTVDVVSGTRTGRTIVTLTAGNTWGADGTISETESPNGHVIDGFMLRFIYPSLIALDTPVQEILTENVLPSQDAFSMYIDYGFDAEMSYGAMGHVTELRAVNVPEPDSAILLGLGTFALAACIRRKSVIRP
jgi:hypothetical protein